MRRPQPASIILVGKSILLREGLARLLCSANFRILASVSCADDLLPSKATLPRQLVLIVHTGNDFDPALEQIELIRERHPGGPIAVVADHYRVSDLVSAFRAGANGYLVDVTTCDIFIKSVELLMMGEVIFPPAFLSFMLDAGSSQLTERTTRDKSGEPILVTTEDTIAPQLSPREKSILRCLIEGDSNKCIARKIDIAEATVKVHVKAILRKIRVQNRTQAAIWGINNGTLPRPASSSPPPPVSDASERPPNSISAMSAIKQVQAPTLADVVDKENHAEVVDFDRLIRKGITRTAARR
ncbi:response regulator transcription factor [Bradyrhizobium sp. LjRoot220]|uniref:LuxR C-terminal-related transcriptional regulator n=1 Tax=Bradyrhizobium sp. LjRoot220 TaxID=3342284 RepID=UPI003ED02AF8